MTYPSAERAITLDLRALIRSILLAISLFKASLGLKVICPVVASTATVAPAFVDAASTTPGQATIAAIPFDLAMIAVWLVGPPPAVTIARILSVAKSAVSAGDKSCAIKTVGTSKCGISG